MNIFESETGGTRTWLPTMILSAGMLLLIIAGKANWGGAWFYAQMLALPVGVALVSFYAFHLYDLVARMQIERAKLRAELSPEVIVIGKKMALVERQTRLAETVARLTAEQIGMLAEWEAAPAMNWRGGKVVAYLTLDGVEIPWANVYAWVEAYWNNGNRPPRIGYWNDNRQQEYAQVITRWFVTRKAFLPAAGNQPAMWDPGLTERHHRALLAESGIAWVAFFWGEYLRRIGETEAEELAQ